MTIDQFLIDLLIACMFFTIVSLIILTLKIRHMEVELNDLEALQESNRSRFNAHDNVIQVINNRVTELEDSREQSREYIKSAILAETAKFGLHPSEYVAKHAKKEEKLK
jgi:hypothetical protein